MDRSLTSTPPVERMHAFMDKLKQEYPYFIGFPGATDFDYSELYPFFGGSVN